MNSFLPSPERSQLPDIRQAASDMFPMVLNAFQHLQSLQPAEAPTPTVIETNAVVTSLDEVRARKQAIIATTAATAVTETAEAAPAEIVNLDVERSVREASAQQLVAEALAQSGELKRAA